jgi:tetratricopeptide (TPR) repeat protein
MRDDPSFSFFKVENFRSSFFKNGFIGLLWLNGFLMVLGCAGAQTVNSAAGLADPLENLQGSARDLSLGSAFVGVADDTSALFFNSAGLSGLSRPEVGLNHNSYLAGTFQETLTAGFPAGDLGGLAFALDYVNWGTIDLRDSLGNAQGDFNDSDVGFTAGWGREWLPGFSVGIALRALQQKVVNDLYSSLAADLGLLWTVSPGWKLGLSYLNLGTPLGGSALTQELKVGGSFFTALSPSFTLLTALSGSVVPNGLGGMQAGLEGVLDRRWALRVGYQIPFYDNQVSGFANFTAGAGVKFSSLSLDYAYLPFGNLGTSNRISLSYQFDLPKQTVQVPVTVIEQAPQPVEASKEVEMEFKIQTPPSDPVTVGQALEKQGQDAQAAQTYVKALQTDPENDRLWNALGRLYYRLGQKTYAIQCFEKVIQLEPKNQALQKWLDQYKALPSTP